MARVIIYDPAHENERVVNDLGYISASSYLPRVGVDVVIYGKGATFPTLVEPLSLYWRHDTGTIRDMDTAEKLALDAEIAAEQLAARRAGGQAQMTNPGPLGVSKRAIAEVMIREVNIIRGWITDYKVEVAAATSLADLQARVAAMPDLDDRTLAQAKTAYDNICGDGTAD